RDLGLSWPKFAMHFYSRADDRMRKIVGFHLPRLKSIETPVNRKASKFRHKANRRGMAVEIPARTTPALQDKINRRGAKNAERRFVRESLCYSQADISKHLILRKSFFFPCLLCVLRASAVKSLSLVSGFCLCGFRKQCLAKSEIMGVGSPARKTPA